MKMVLFLSLGYWVEQPVSKVRKIWAPIAMVYTVLPELGKRQCPASRLRQRDNVLECQKKEKIRNLFRSQRLN